MNTTVKPFLHVTRPMALFSRKPKGPFLKTSQMTMHWDTEDPFTFVSHHEDDYPEGNAQQAPPLQQIAGRNLGRDYRKIMGFRMYNGKVVPGFPMHAHWGYETVTLPQIGYVDHFDNLGIKGRFGFGDVQWVSAPGFYEHCEMYPLVRKDARNPNDITQIMINIPLEEKDGECSVSTVWRDDVPVVESDGCRVQVVCGTFGGRHMESPNGCSWAKGDRVRILRMEFQPGGRVTIDPFTADGNRNLYFVSGGDARVMGAEVGWNLRMKIDPTAEVDIENGDEVSVMWMLEGVPIGERMVPFGPIIARDDREVREKLQHIRENEFKEWPWDIIDKTNPAECGSFIEYPDGES